MELVAEMRAAVLAAYAAAEALVMAAAVSDFRPAEVGAQKIKKNEGRRHDPGAGEERGLLPRSAGRVVKVAFAAETRELDRERARKPLSHGHLDLICANDVSAPDSGFGTDTNRVTIIDAAGDG